MDFSWELMTTVLYLNLLITTTQAAEKVKAYHLVTLSFRWYHSYKQGKKKFYDLQNKMYIYFGAKQFNFSCKGPH